MHYRTKIQLIVVTLATSPFLQPLIAVRTSRRYTSFFVLRSNRISLASDPTTVSSAHLLPLRDSDPSSGDASLPRILNAVWL